eukprot:gb/GFBE01052083.1/.p1 GENE.gb/GFBE01052083.1/~~gb/GFBE01052083.1/.p1  ORF type:complete len:248 (+),score=57.31 gb/GFBE01052083.1/:1-744(+)
MDSCDPLPAQKKAKLSHADEAALTPASERVQIFIKDVHWQSISVLTNPDKDVQQLFDIVATRFGTPPELIWDNKFTANGRYLELGVPLKAYSISGGSTICFNVCIKSLWNADFGHKLVNLTVATLAGGTDLKVGPFCRMNKVVVIKQQLQQLLQIPISRQKLVMGAQILEDSCEIGELADRSDGGVFLSLVCLPKPQGPPQEPPGEHWVPYLDPDLSSVWWYYDGPCGKWWTADLAEAEILPYVDQE